MRLDRFTPARVRAARRRALGSALLAAALAVTAVSGVSASYAITSGQARSLET